VIVGYYQDGKLLYAGKVRAGFVPHVRREIMEKMETPEDRSLSVCQSPREEKDSMGADKG